MQRETLSIRFPLGSRLPEFALPCVDGTNVGADYLRSGKAALVVFTCNHCPYVKGTELMLLDIVKRFAPLGLRTVAINANDPVAYPDDSFEKMREKSNTLKLPYPYLWDESQAVARTFDAACTPECYLFDSSGALVFHGAITDRPKESAAPRADFLSPVIEATLAGRAPAQTFAHPIGCSIKWR